MNTTWAALLEPNRVRIVELLREGPLTVGAIAERLGLRQPQASKHIKVLAEAGIVAVRPRANRRVCELQREPFEEMETWLESFRRLWKTRFDQLDEYVQETSETPAAGQRAGTRKEEDHA